MPVTNESVQEFLDLSWYINKQNKICVYIYAKHTNGFMYILPSAYKPKRNIIPQTKKNMWF